MEIMQYQTTRSALKYLGEPLQDSTNNRQSRAPSIVSSPTTDNCYETSVELHSDTRALREFCDRHHLATCSVFQSAWAIVVSCYAAIEDVSFIYSTNKAQTSDPELERSYPCRVQIDPKSYLLDILLVANGNIENLSNHNDHLVTGELNQSLNGAAPNFSSRLHVNYWNGQQDGESRRDENLSMCNVSVQIAMKSDASLTLRIRADASKLPNIQLDDVAHTLSKTLLEITKAQPQSLIKDLDICSERDMKKILGWNQSTPDPVESCFHWHFETVARKTPDATAICSWDRSFTYQELDTMSTKLANELRHLGVVPETFVGICFNKSSIAYVCMMSILKAGGAFVAIDPSDPAARIQTIVRATKASIFMTEPAHSHLFEGFTKPVLAINAKVIDELPLRPCLPGLQPNPSNVAYAVFTSGSTGSPKGIMIEHRSLCTAVRALASPLRIDSSSRVLQFAAYTFDVSYGDTFVTLAQGGCICVPSEHEKINDVSGSLVRMNVNNVCLIPSVARMIQPEDVPCLTVLNLGGEALMKDNLETWSERVTLSVVYGPTECTVWCASQTNLNTNDPHDTIGRGIGTLLWITNATNHDRLCPIGCTGELLIEGPGLARGYIDGEQTREAFIENPSWAHAKPGQHRRFYKTGDLVRYQPDGTLSFVGRKDTQIKLHGRRIELGEIEYHLSCHDLFKQSMVLLPSAGKHRQKLVAIIVLKTSVASSKQAIELKPLSGIDRQEFINEQVNIEAFLSSRLPYYMLPQEWIVVEHIPLMVSGKMDRVLSKKFVESLTEAVGEDASQKASQSRATENLVEDRLRHIWSQVLEINVKEVGLGDGFVSLGGDSFTAMDLVARCKAQGYSLTVADALNDSTIQQMAAKVMAAPPTTVGSAHGERESLRDQHRFAVRKPLVLRPSWWDT